MKKIIPNIFILAIGISILMSGFMPKPACAGRPLATEDAGVAGERRFQIEASLNYIKNNNGDENQSFILVPIYGLTERLEFSAEIPYTLINLKEGDRAKGIQDVNLVLKNLIVPESKNNPAFLLKTQVKLSNGDYQMGLGSGDNDVGFVAVFTKQSGKYIIHANLGYTFAGKKVDVNLRDYIMYGIACEYSLNNKINIVGEVYGESDSHFDTGGFKYRTLNPLLGFTYKLNEKAILDTAFRIGISDGQKSEYGLAAGLSLNF